MPLDYARPQRPRRSPWPLILAAMAVSVGWWGLNRWIATAPPRGEPTSDPPTAVDDGPAPLYPATEPDE